MHQAKGFTERGIALFGFVIDPQSPCELAGMLDEVKVRAFAEELHRFGCENHLWLPDDQLVVSNVCIGYDELADHNLPLEIFFRGTGGLVNKITADKIHVNDLRKPITEGLGEICGMILGSFPIVTAPYAIPFSVKTSEENVEWCKGSISHLISGFSEIATRLLGYEVIAYPLPVMPSDQR